MLINLILRDEIVLLKIIDIINAHAAHLLCNDEHKLSAPKYGFGLKFLVAKIILYYLVLSPGD